MVLSYCRSASIDFDVIITDSFRRKCQAKWTVLVFPNFAVDFTVGHFILELKNKILKHSILFLLMFRQVP